MDEDVLQFGRASVRRSILRNAMIILILGSIGFAAIDSWVRLAMEEYYTNAYRPQVSHAALEQ